MTLNLDLKKAKKHKYTTLIDLHKALKPIEEADEVKRKFVKQKKKGDNNQQHHHKRRVETKIDIN